MQVNSAEYQEHAIFDELTLYAKFYDNLYFLNMNWVTQGVSSLLNMDTYIFSSIQETLESIYDVLNGGVSTTGMSCFVNTMIYLDEDL